MCFIARVFHHPRVFHYGVPCSPWFKYLFYCVPPGCARTMGVASTVVQRRCSEQWRWPPPLFRTTALSDPKVLAQPEGARVKQRAAWGLLMKNTRAMKHTLELSNPTSPLGSGGLAWYICFHPLFFSTLRLSTLWGEVYFSSYPLRLKNGPGSLRLKNGPGYRCTATPE